MLDDHTNIINFNPEITHEKRKEDCKHIHTTITSQYHNLRKNNKGKLSNPHLMIFIHQNKHYHVIYVQNWHSLEQTNHHSYIVIYLQRVNPDTYMP